MRDSNTILDEALILACQSGDESGFDPLVRRWHPRQLRYLTALTGRPDIAQDVAQEVWLAVVRDLRRLNDPAAFPAWLFQVGYRRSIDWMRAQNRRAGLLRQHAKNQSAVTTGGLTSLTDEIDEETAALHAAIAKLPADQREVLVQYYLQENPISAIALQLVIPVGTVKSRLFNARQRLRVILDYERNEP